MSATERVAGAGTSAWITAAMLAPSAQAVTAAATNAGSGGLPADNVITS